MGAKAVSTGYITIVDLSDARTASLQLQSNKSKIQTCESNYSGFSPDYTSSILSISPIFYFGNTKANVNYSYGSGTYNLITYKVNDAAVPTTNTSSNDMYVSNGVLYIKKNLTQSVPYYYINATISNLKDPSYPEMSYGETVISAAWEVALLPKGGQGDTGKGIKSVTEQFAAYSSNETAPGEGWGTSYSLTSTNKYLWSRLLITYTDNSASTSTPVFDSAMSVTQSSLSNLNSSLSDLNSALSTFINTTYVTDKASLQSQIDGAIETWYLEGAPTKDNEPAKNWETDDEKKKHEGDLYYDKNTGYSYRYLGTTSGSTTEYKWERISDTAISEAMTAASNAQAAADKKMTIFYGTESDSKSPEKDWRPEAGDLWVKSPSGDQYIWSLKSGSTTEYEWKSSTTVTDNVVSSDIYFCLHTSNSTAPSAPSEASGETKRDSYTVDSIVWKTNMADLGTRGSKYYWQATRHQKKGGAIAWSAPVCVQGITGSNGADAIFAIVDLTSKVLTDSVSSSTLTANIYSGGTEITPTSYKWTCTDSSIANYLSLGTDKTLTVTRAMVNGANNFKCEITYNNKKYTDTVAIEDKVDPIYVEITSSAGEKLTAADTGTTLKAIIHKANSLDDVDSAGTLYTYQWQNESVSPATNLGTGKTLTLTRAQINAKMVVECTVTEK